MQKASKPICLLFCLWEDLRCLNANLLSNHTSIMVVVKTAAPSEAIASTNSELHMVSGQVIRYVAPVPLDSENNNDHQHVVMLAQEKRLLFGDINDELDKWIGVSEMCQAIDHLVEIDMETDLFKGKNVLEVGFTSGLPSVYAMEHGAKNATIYSSNATLLDAYAKPTMRRNNIRNNVEFVTGEIEDLKTMLTNTKYDIILAPELVNTKSEYFEEIHDMLETVLSDNGMIFFSGRTHYNTCDGNMQSMLDIIKSKNRFDAIDRSPMLQNHTAPRKIFQLMRKIF
uniref:Uncharacterized protein n=1 Tax=Panagrolaimus sp. JU765 TaxID=591449 RepID=A0AC34QC19_9BILA